MHTAERTELELFLAASVASSMPVQPSTAIDALWHEALASPIEYDELCRRVGADRAIEHGPALRDLGTYLRTREAVVAQSADPARWWPLPAAGEAYPMADCVDQRSRPPLAFPVISEGSSDAN